jgi:hypothetical protein
LAPGSSWRVLHGSDDPQSTIDYHHP